MTDQQFGGLSAQLYLDKDGIPVPNNDVKGCIWKVNYHYAIFLAEALRLKDAYPGRIQQLNAP